MQPDPEDFGRKEDFAGIQVALLTGGFDKPYTFGLAMALASKEVGLDLIGGDDIDCPEMHQTAGLRFLNLRGSKQAAGMVAKMTRILGYYARLIRYAVSAQPRVFHILWNNKFELFDRTLLMLYYKLLGKRVLLTTHNVNAGKRDGNDSLLNRLTLRVQYRLADHIFVHTELMKQQLREEFGVNGTSVTVIPFGINNSVPNTTLTAAGARERLGIEPGSRIILFFGSVRPYKGVDRLVAAFQTVAAKDSSYRLVIAGLPPKEDEKYARSIEEQIARHPTREQVLAKLEYVPDEDTELYFKAADLLVLPYTQIFQSGVLYLAYGFGLPVVASDVGPFHDDVLDGRTGFLYDPENPTALARTIERYFASDLYHNLSRRRDDIRRFAEQTHSWDTVGETTIGVYKAELAQ